MIVENDRFAEVFLAENRLGQKMIVLYIVQQKTNTQQNE